MALLGGMTSCGGGDDNYIPPAIEDPEKPDKPDKPDTPDDGYNHNLGDDFVAHKEGEPYNTYKGLVMCGYQGWFGTPDDGSPMTKVGNQTWYHYRESEQFRPGVLRNSIDFWPDMREYEKTYTPSEEEYKGTIPVAPFYLPDGSKATLFSSYDESTVMLHFKWMQQYGIDGVFMQRFVGEIMSDDHKDHFDVVLKHAMKASNKYERAIAVMYDLGGVTAKNPNMISTMMKDAQELYDEYQLSGTGKQKFYLHENSKPVLALWGVGFPDDGHPTPTYIEPYIDQLKAMGWSIVLGCPACWRSSNGDYNDCVRGAERNKLIELIKKCDGFLPWYVGRYGHDNFASSTWKKHIQDDIKEAAKYSTDGHNVVYALHVFPGGSDRNMHPNNGYPTGDPTLTGFRNHGKFYWDQLYHDIKSGAQAIYIGMFDEIDEGTAIFKQMHVSDVPSNVYDGKDYWVNFFTDGHYSMTASEVTNGVQWSRLASELEVKFQGIDDDLPTSHYMWLAGQARKMLVGEIKMEAAKPTQPAE